MYWSIAARSRFVAGYQQQVLSILARITGAKLRAAPLVDAVAGLHF
jgi:hypothetical protein